MSKIREALKSNYLFQELTPDEVDQIAGMNRLFFVIVSDNS